MLIEPIDIKQKRLLLLKKLNRWVAILIAFATMAFFFIKILFL